MRTIQNLFPTTLGFSQLDTLLCNNMGNEVLKLIDPTLLESDGGETTADNLNQLPQFSSLVDLIHLEVSAFADEVLGLEKNSLQMSCMWSNVHKYNNAHKWKNLHGKHLHPNAFLSGVIYLSVPDDDMPGSIEFFDPRSAKVMQQPTYTKVTDMSVITHTYDPVVGMLILFPSWLEHRVNMFKTSTNDARISASFNYSLVRSSGPTMKITNFGV